MSTIAISGLAAPPVARSAPLSGELLADIAAGLAASEELWRPHAHHDPAERRPVRLVVCDLWEAWVVGWTAGQHVDAHDHGDSAGVARGGGGRPRRGAPRRPHACSAPGGRRRSSTCPVGVVHDVVGLGRAVDEHPRVLTAARHDDLLRRRRSARPGRGDRRRAGHHRPAQRLPRPAPEPAPWLRAPSTACSPRPGPASIGCGPRTSRPSRRPARSWSTSAPSRTASRRASCPAPWSSTATTSSGGSTRRATRRSPKPPPAAA